MKPCKYQHHTLDCTEAEKPSEKDFMCALYRIALNGGV